MMKITCLLALALGLHLTNGQPLSLNSLEDAIEALDDSLFKHGHSMEKHGHSLERHGHSVEKHGHSAEKHGHSVELHDVTKRKVDDLDQKEKEIEDLINEVENEQVPSGERVEMSMDAQNDPEAAKMEAALREQEDKLLQDGAKAFQDFDANINAALKQEEAVEDVLRKDIDEQSEHRIQD